MKRRYFLKAVALTGIASTFRFSDGLEIMAQNAKGYDLIAVLGGTPEDMFKKAIAELGGMKKFVQKGQKVVVKPNIGWDRSPELAANTNPDLVAAIIKDCFAAGAKEVIVFDHTCDDWRKCYKNSGIEAAVEKIPDLWSLILRIPLTEAVSKAEKAFLRSCFFFVATGAANATVEAKLIDSREERGNLQLVAADFARCGSGDS